MITVKVPRINIGQCIRISDNEAGIVIEAAAILNGSDIYKVIRAFDDEGETAYVVDAEVLTPGGPLCAECPLWFGGRCGL